MKKKILMAALILICGMLLRAATNAAPRAVTEITSDSADFDLDAHRAVYYGDVFVDDPQMKLNCDQLTVLLPQTGGRPDRIVAEKNVVIDFTDDKGQTNHVTSEQAVYTYKVQSGVTNEVVTFTGNPQIENAMGSQAGDVIVWDRVSGMIHFDNPHMISHQNPSGHADTNSPLPKLF